MKIRLIVAQQIGASAAKFDEFFNRNEAAGGAAFYGTANPEATLTNPIAPTSPGRGLTIN
jgi:hypothetical protein